MSEEVGPEGVSTGEEGAQEKPEAEAIEGAVTHTPEKEADEENKQNDSDVKEIQPSENQETVTPKTENGEEGGKQKEVKSPPNENEGRIEKQEETKEPGADEKTEQGETSEWPVEERLDSDTLNETFKEEKAGDDALTAKDSGLVKNDNEVLLLVSSGSHVHEAEDQSDSPEEGGLERDLEATRKHAVPDDVLSDHIDMTPMTPRGSRLSYDGNEHAQHQEAKDVDIKVALDSLVEDGGPRMEPDTAQTTATQEAKPVSVEPELTYRARAYDEKKIMSAMKAPEYSSAVWARSYHAKKVDAELNNDCRIVTGQLRPTPLPPLYRTAGIAPPDIRRQTHGSTEKHKQETDLRHPLFDHSYPRARLKTRKSFRTVESVQPDQAASHRLELWNIWDNTTNEATQPPKEQLPSGRELQRKDWVTLNRARAKVGKTASTLHKWKLRPNSECP
ncbi:RNA-directed DNA polymerase from mobile element jockey-like protein [Elysia marginata]|uniref:RNA-directed DNA polymerase from mobile element jockey-like protein n=1 Tax=Elysia marginata TaxID=1093978 RepID=A0AAV4J8F6_9GAST|nr:RNA-directed DNA polymerase from mobile element jockey-like protein [Elysia marginata]